MLLYLLGAGIIIYAMFFFEESGLFRMKRTKKYEATVVDESEKEVYNNTGGTNVRFFKVYEYFDGEENRVVASERPMRHINSDVGRKCVIYVDEKNRKAMEKKDVKAYRICGILLVLLGLFIILATLYIKKNVPGAVF